SSTHQISGMSDNVSKSIVGLYGPWLAQSRQNPGKYSFRHSQYTDVEEWQQKIVPLVKEYLARPELDYTPSPRITRSYQYDGLDIEELEWTLPYGHPTRAVLLKPAEASGSLPGILGLHDHGG